MYTRFPLCRKYIGKGSLIVLHQSDVGTGSLIVLRMRRSGNGNILSSRIPLAISQAEAGV
jgi:hypothetical protein